MVSRGGIDLTVCRSPWSACVQGTREGSGNSENVLGVSLKQEWEQIMITREDAIRQADEWINGGKSQGQRREIGVGEFDPGFVIWAIEASPADLSKPPPTIGSATGVIDKTTGKLTMMPGLPSDVIIARCRARQSAGTADARHGTC